MERVVPVLAIDDYHEALNFYISALGFTILFEHRHDPGFPVFMGIAKGKLLLSLSEHSRGHQGSEVYLYVNDVEAWYRLCLENDITPSQPPQKMPWGNTEMLLSDPFRNALRITQVNTHEGASTPKR